MILLALILVPATAGAVAFILRPHGLRRALLQDRSPQVRFAAEEAIHHIDPGP